MNYYEIYRYNKKTMEMTNQFYTSTALNIATMSS
jgi:hypothetical protein